MKIIVIGAGAWGTALAVQASSTHSVSLLARSSAQVAQMQATRQNAQYLSGVLLPPALNIGVANPAQMAAAGADLIVLATPMRALREWLQHLQGSRAPVAWLCKGFDESGLLGHEIAAQVAPQLVAGPGCGILSGPSFAQEVAQQQPTALVAASHNAALRALLVEAFHSNFLRVYSSEDIVGVEVGGAVKNVLAIATGLCDGLQLGLNARAALITRGLAEMTRLGLALGAMPDTFMGLSGLGDLVLTATGSLSRNRQVGLLLAQGQTVQQAVNSLGHVAEGVYSARTVLTRAQSLAVQMPLTQCVVALLDGQLKPQEAVAVLMAREARGE
jgi:glycerol-3-phosphate dehydrogenase (NAD(P)+)